jgi:tRNA 5-methylaminomethyl-2-thiouridine biosynthesis bifunctional protein
MDVQPDRLSFDASGAPYSERYGDVYASRDGALGQARHVFLAGVGLPERWRGRPQFVVLETGFGLGVNFLATWQQWRADPQRCERLHFVSIERHPLNASDLAAVPAELRSMAAELAARWPFALPGLHRLEFERGRVVLTLAFGDARTLAPLLALGADAIYLDGFAPDRNPEMWERSVLKAVARCARPRARLATWTTARCVRDTLRDSGFVLETRPGFGHKREMVTGKFAPAWQVRRHEPPAGYQGERSAFVIGAGIAGATCAEALARRGWSVKVLDRDARPFSAPVLPAGLMYPVLAADDARLARLARAGVALAASALARVAPDGVHGSTPVWHRNGVAQLAGDAATMDRWRTAIERLAAPLDFVELCNAEELSRRAGVTLRRGGLWWPRGTVVTAEAWGRALLASPCIETRTGVEVARLERKDSRWRAVDATGTAVADAAVAIVAGALDSPRLLRSTAPVRSVPGRLTLLAPGVLPGLRAPVSGNGYLLRGPAGELAVGATYETPFPDAESADWLSEEQGAKSNLARLDRLLAEPPAVSVAGSLYGVRCVARDRLPLAGPAADEGAARERHSELRGAQLDDLPRQSGLYGSYAMASRGLTLAPLAAELIAAHVEGEPMPVERDLLAASDPARFLLRWLRHASGQDPGPAGS